MEENLNSLFQQFFKEMIKKGLDNIPPGSAKGKKSSSMEDVYKMFEDFVERAKAAGTTFFEDDSKEESSKKEESIDYLKEIAELKEQVEALKNQLKDKEEIIKLLKEKSAKQKKQKQ